MCLHGARCLAHFRIVFDCCTYLHSVLLQLRGLLTTAQAEAKSLQGELAKAHGSAADSEKFQQALSQAEEGSRALLQERRREQALLEKQLQATGRDRDQLAQQVSHLTQIRDSLN